MFKKKYIIIAVGIICILLGSFFINNVLLAQSSGEYDPWLDYNEDGTIDVNDLYPLGQTYGSSGDPTKDVFVTNWPGMESGLDQSLGSATIPPYGEWYSSSALLDGYKQYYIYAIISSPSGSIYYLWHQFKAGGIWIDDTQAAMSVPLSTIFGPYDVTGPELRLYLYNSLAYSISVQFAIYAPPY